MRLRKALKHGRHNLQVKSMFPMCSEAESKCVEVRLVGWLVAQLTFMQETRLSVPPESCYKHSLFY